MIINWFDYPSIDPEENARRRELRAWHAEHRDELDTAHAAWRKWYADVDDLKTSSIVGRRVIAFDGYTITLEGGATVEIHTGWDGDVEVSVPDVDLPPQPPRAPEPPAHLRGPTIDITDQLAALDHDQAPLAALLHQKGKHQ